MLISGKAAILLIVYHLVYNNMIILYLYYVFTFHSCLYLLVMCTHIYLMTSLYYIFMVAMTQYVMQCFPLTHPQRF